MTVREVVSSSEFENEINKKILTVAKFGADWCGPCRMIAPVVEQLAKKYPNVNFIQINTDKSQWTAQRGVSALPTFQFYVSGKMLDELRGANPQELESKVVRHKVEAPQAFTGQGFTLGANNNAMSESDFREARLKAFQSANPKPSVQSNTSVYSTANANADMDVEDPELAKALALSIAESQPNLSTTSAPASIPIKRETANNVLSAEEQDKLDTAEAVAAQAEEDNAWGEEMVPVPVNTELLQELIEMGFSDIRARKGLVHGQTLEGALQWIDEHQDDPDIDQPYMVKKSDTMPKPILTEEQKQQKLKDMKEKIQARKAEKSKFEKEAEIQREKERRERGKNMTEVQEERDKLIRKRELEKQKKEKMDAEKERQRLRAEIARDKELRKLNKGVLPSVLGIDGYNPSAVQYEQTAEGTVPPPTGSTNTTTSSTPVITTTVKPVTPAVVPKKVIPTSDITTQISVTAMSIDERIQKIDSAIATLMKYRTGGDGGNALKLLITFVKNIHDNPKEMKYRSINTESNAYKSKFGPLVGPSMILKMLGFIKSSEDATKLILEGDIDMNLFNTTTSKLIQAENTYRHMNS